MRVQKKQAPLQVRVEIPEGWHGLCWQRLSLAGSSEHRLQPAPSLCAWLPRPRPHPLPSFAFCFVLDLWAEMLMAVENFN